MHSFEVTPRSGTDKIANFAAGTASLAVALRQTLRLLRHERAGQDLHWFDILEAEALKAAANTIVDGLSIEDDAEAVQFAVDVVSAVFAAERYMMGRGVGSEARRGRPL